MYFASMELLLSVYVSLYVKFHSDIAPLHLFATRVRCSSAAIWRLNMNISFVHDTIISIIHESKHMYLYKSILLIYIFS